LVDEVFTPQINQVRSLLVVRQVCAYTSRHRHNERVVIHVLPIRPADKLVVPIAHERTIEIGGQVRLIEFSHSVSPQLTAALLLGARYIRAHASAKLKGFLPTKRTRACCATRDQGT
jgi:hypothetical protein